MKKLISLLLTLVMVLSMLTVAGFAVDVSAQIHPDLASIKVTHTGDPSASYYFEDLCQPIIDWMCLNLAGKKTITLLQDTEIYSITENNILTIPTSSSKWYNKDLAAARENPVVLDLGGNTLTFYGGGNLFYFERFGMNVTNGTLIYTNTVGKNRVPFCFGTSAGSTANSAASSSYAPVLNLDNVHVYSTTGTIINTYLYDTTVNITDSVVWGGTSGNAMGMLQTKQSSVSQKWQGAYQPALNLKNSIMGCEKYYFVSGTIEGATATVEDSIVVSNSTANPIAKTTKITTNFIGERTENMNWSMTLRDGRTVSGKAYTFGTAPAVMPFSDVKEADWYYSFVKELYGKKIVAGQTATTFNPNGNLTYGAALKLLVVGLTGKDAGNAASGHWASNYLQAAKTAGWTDANASKLDTPITREAFCEIAAKAKNLTKQPAANKFTDTTNTAVLALVEAGVINGMSETEFRPAGILTRAQISKIISLLLKL